MQRVFTQAEAALSKWRGLTQVDGLLAQAYLDQGMLQPALAAIDEAIEASRNIPGGLYFVPKNLAFKGEIIARSDTSWSPTICTRRVRTFSMRSSARFRPLRLNVNYRAI
jgi:hypothetical protein